MSDAVGLRPWRRRRHRAGQNATVDEGFSRAVIAYVGDPGRPDGRTPEQRVSDAMGENAVDLVPRAAALLYELNTANPPLYAATLADVDVRVRHHLRERHPELTEDAITAAANRFTYDWR
jgi:hypothetical protein